MSLITGKLAWRQTGLGQNHVIERVASTSDNGTDQMQQRTAGIHKEIQNPKQMLEKWQTNHKHLDVKKFELYLSFSVDLEKRPAKASRTT